MRKATALMMAVAMLATAGSTFGAQQKADPESAKKATEQRGHTTKGTVKTFDAATNTLTISTAKGVEESFMLGPKANLREGEKTIAASDLAKLAGREATIRYMESEGKKHAESVMVSTGAPAKPSGTSGTEKPKPTGEPAKKY
jgi:hypothetical protein